MTLDDIQDNNDKKVPKPYVNDLYAQGRVLDFLNEIKAGMENEILTQEKEKN